MKLEIRYPDKPAHEVELTGAMAVLGRDPSCDLVLNDERCSRRHAVLELTPTGLQVRDAGSANGVFVNGKKLERSLLTTGDLIRLGDVIVKVLPEGVTGTVVVADGELLELGPPPPGGSSPAGPSALGTAERPRGSSSASGLRAPRPPSGPIPTMGASTLRGGAASSSSSGRAPSPPTPASRTGAAIGPGAAAGRPLTVTLLAALWLVCIVVYAVQAVLALTLNLDLGRGAALGAATASLALALVSATMAYGLFGLKPWARSAQAVIAGLGLLVCPFTLASATTLIYTLRPSTRAAFQPGAKAPTDPAEMTFALTLAGTVVLGAALCLVGVIVARVVH